jgi:hypothetical protein
MPKTLTKLMCFCGEMVLITGEVIGTVFVGREEYAVVDFEYDNVPFRGIWKPAECE